MRNLNISIDSFSEQQIKIIAECLKGGGVIAYPTDTVYGLGCSALDDEAVSRLIKMKTRGPDKALLVLAGSWKMINDHFFVSKQEKEQLKNFWPGPVTALLRPRDIFSPKLAPGKDKIGVRLPNNEFLIKMIKEAGVPVVSTSLNISGEKVLNDVSDIKGYFDPDPDLVVNAGQLPNRRPSKLIDMEDNGRIRVIRE